MSEDLVELRAAQIGAGEPWDELKVKHLWFHVVRDLVQGGEIAKVGAIPFCVYIVIKSHTDMQTGHAKPSVARIAELVGVSHDTVQRALKKLVQAGLIKLERKGTGREGNTYSVVEKINIVTSAGEPWGVGQRKYASTFYKEFVDELQRLARTGNLPGDRNVTINLTVNISNVQQAEGSTVNITQFATAAPATRDFGSPPVDAELRNLLLKKL